MARITSIFACLFAFLCPILSSADPARADERLAGIACRSVHLGYPTEEATGFYSEVTVEKSAPGTYFMACGFSMGYFGIQELANGKKLALFSVWDPGSQNDPNEVADSQRVKLVSHDLGVRIGRFGNEGTGGQSFYDVDWQPMQTYCFLVTAVVKEGRTEYSGYFRPKTDDTWKHLVTFSTLAGGKLLKGCYSFVEDFRRNRESTKFARIARFGNGWVRDTQGNWTPLLNARFTADANPVANINAGLAGNDYFLATGGTTENKDAKLKETISRPAQENARPPELPAAIKP